VGVYINKVDRKDHLISQIVNGLLRR
jgi:hypothetical protein